MLELIDLFNAADRAQIEAFGGRGKRQDEPGAVGDFPLSAASKAVRWSILGEAKEPSVAKFVRTVSLTCGHRVLERKRALLSLVGTSTSAA
jgi:hypothetical protein